MAKCIENGMICTRDDAGVLLKRAGYVFMQQLDIKSSCYMAGQDDTWKIVEDLGGNTVTIKDWL